MCVSFPQFVFSFSFKHMYLNLDKW
jgi:hypothetical protein